jgi:hypothetical protein
VFFPDTAGVYEISDPRMLDALYVDRYWQYLRTFVSRGITDRFTAMPGIEARPNLAGNPMFDLLGARYVLSFHSDDPSSLGTDGQFRLLLRRDAISVWENTHVLPRAFVVHDVHRVDDVDGALGFFVRGATRFRDGTIRTAVDPAEEAVVEAPAGSLRAGSACPSPGADSARIVSRTADEVRIRVHADCAGLLVLSDQYFPGWNATVNGHDAAVHPTDVALRGVAVPQGASSVVFRYEPASFGRGVLVGGLGLVALVAVAVPLRRRRPGPRPSGAGGDAPVVTGGGGSIR